MPLSGLLVLWHPLPCTEKFMDLHKEEGGGKKAGKNESGGGGRAGLLIDTLAPLTIDCHHH